GRPCRDEQAARRNKRCTKTAGAMNKHSHPKPLADLVTTCVADVFARQGFTSCEIVTHWDDIVGAEVAKLAEPVRMQWIRSRDPDESPPATLVLRVEGP